MNVGRGALALRFTCEIYYHGVILGAAAVYAKWNHSCGVSNRWYLGCQPVRLSSRIAVVSLDEFFAATEPAIA